MYTSIPNSEGIKAVKTSLENFPTRTVATKVITTFVSLILTSNTFVFDCKNYLQVKDCAMWTICATVYAKIFIDHFERKYIYPFLKELSLSYLKFINGIFIIWTGSKDQLIISLFLTGKFTTKTTNHTQRYCIQKRNRQNFLHINLEHPMSLKNGIPYNQVLRVKRTCLTIENFKLYCSELKQKFIDKGYQKWNVTGKS